jgi:hypothetical protein
MVAGSNPVSPTKVPAGKRLKAVPPPSGCGRGRRLGLFGRNCAVATTGWWRCREGAVAAVADAVVVPCRPDQAVAAHPLVPVRPIGILLAVASSEAAETPLPSRTVVLRQVRLVRVWRLETAPGYQGCSRVYCGTAKFGLYPTGVKWSQVQILSARPSSGAIFADTCLPSDACGIVAELPANADVQDLHVVPIPQLLAERHGLRPPVGV